MMYRVANGMHIQMAIIKSSMMRTIMVKRRYECRLADIDTQSILIACRK